MKLPRLEICILRIRVIKNLDLHTDICRVSLLGRSNSNSVVRTSAQLEFKFEMKVRVILRGQQILSIWKRGDRTIFDGIPTRTSDPSIESLPVKERFKSRFRNGRGGRRWCRSRRRSRSGRSLPNHDAQRDECKRSECHYGRIR